MKLSTTPTDTIAIAARTNSEIESCDFALLTLSPETIGYLIRRSNIARSLSDEGDFKTLEFWGQPDGFYMSYFDNEELEELQQALETNDWCYITLEEVEKVPNKLEDLEAHAIRFDKDGNIQFSASDKYSYTECWTSEIKLNDILEGVQ